jgi:uncharacterized membrane protein
MPTGAARSDPRPLVVPAPPRRVRSAAASRVEDGQPSLLAAVCLLAVAAISATMLAGGNLAIRGLLAPPLALFAPGYAVASALLDARWRRGPELLLLSLGMSLAIGAVGGLVLSWTAWGLTAASWTCLLGGVTLGGGAVGALRAGRSAGSDLPPVAARRTKRGLPKRDRALLVLAGLIVLGALILAQVGAMSQPSSGFTELWISPPDPSDPAAVHLGMRSHEATPMTFLVRLTAGDQTLREWRPVELEPGATWSATAVLPPVGEQGADGKVEAVVYRADGSPSGETETPYRRVTLRR